MSKKRKTIEVLWKKKYWKKVIEKIVPSHRIILKKWFVFDEFVIFIKFKSNDDLNPSVIDIKPDISVSSKAQNIMMGAIDEGESFLEDPETSDKENFTNLAEEAEKIGNDITSSAEFIQTYLNDLDIFIDVLVEEDEWPKGVLIDEKDPYEKFGKIDKNKKNGFVYFIRNDDIYKIGITDNLMRRMKELQADEIINSVKCINYEILEKDLHQEFKKYRIPQSEYFRLTPELVQKVNEKMIKGAKML